MVGLLMLSFVILSLFLLTNDFLGLYILFSMSGHFLIDADHCNFYIFGARFYFSSLNFGGFSPPWM